jgi:hypothetical protein
MPPSTDVPQARRRVAPLIVALLLLSLVGVTGFAYWNRYVRTAGPSNPGMKCPAVVEARTKPPLAAIGVHRVALIGDSIMVQPSCAVAEGLADVGITTSRHAVSGSGLLNGSTDWVAETKSIMQHEHPDIVVAIFVGNYPPPLLRDAQGQKILADTPAFYAAWQARAAALSNMVKSFHASMYWVSPPPIALGPLSSAARLYDGYRTIPGDHFLDSGKVLAGRNGEEVSVMQTCHRRQVVRSPDTVHLTDDGARIYGEQIAHDLSARLGVLTTPRPC